MILDATFFGIMATLNLQTLLDAIEKSKTEMVTHINAKVDPIQAGLVKIQNSLQTLGDQVEHLEQRVSTNQDNVEDLIERVKTLEKEVTHLREKTDDLESRSRRSNIRVVGIVEHAEDKDIVQFMSRLIPELLGRGNFPATPTIERAHRIPTQVPDDWWVKPNAAGRIRGPRTIIMKMLNYQDKVKILRLAKDMEKIEYKGSRVYFNGDVSASLAARHRSFGFVKRKLRERKIKYIVRHPCTLCVTINGKDERFVCPKAAARALNISPPDSMQNSPERMLVGAAQRY